jgi:hypothetical protein
MLSLLTFSAVLVVGPGSQQAPGDSVSWRKLTAAETVDGVSCAPTGRTSAGIFASGRLHACPVARDTTIEGQRFPAGTWIYLTEDRSLWRAWLIRDTDLSRVRCKGTGFQGWSVEFHPGGMLAMCYLAGEQTLDGVPCREGSFWGEVTGGVKVHFHPNGRLRTCQLARAHTQGGVKYGRRDRIELDTAGAPVPRAPKP